MLKTVSQPTAAPTRKQFWGGLTATLTQLLQTGLVDVGDAVPALEPYAMILSGFVSIGVGAAVGYMVKDRAR